MKEVKNLLSTLIEQCEQYINSLRDCEKGTCLVRGFEGNIELLEKFDHNLDHRQPLNSPVSLHNAVNETFEDRFKWKIRNGAFCYGTNLLRNSLLPSLGYGMQYLFFPIGSYDFVYNPEYFDLYNFFQTEMEEMSQIKDLKFTNDSLCLAMENILDEDYSNEISIKTRHYYLVNPKHRDIIINLIWP